MLGKNSKEVLSMIGVLSLVFLLVGSGVATAAVAGSFSSSYDGWGDSSSTGTGSEEIAVTGTIEVTGNAAVDPTVVVSGSEHTVLDASSVQVFVEGNRNIQLDRSIVGDQNTGETRVIYQTEEIPSGTTLQVEYETYYKGNTGTEVSEFVVGETEIAYELPSGEQQQDTFEATNTLESRPENIIADLEKQLEKGDQVSQIRQYLSYLGGIAVIYLVIKIIAGVVGGNGDDDDNNTV